MAASGLRAERCGKDAPSRVPAEPERGDGCLSPARGVEEVAPGRPRDDAMAAADDGRPGVETSREKREERCPAPLPGAPRTPPRRSRGETADMDDSKADLAFHFGRPNSFLRRAPKVKPTTAPYFALENPILLHLS